METERKLKIGVVGGAGYTAGELLRIIMGHPKVKVDFVYSTAYTTTFLASPTCASPGK